jgi:putative cell wall-binding protein
MLPSDARRVLRTLPAAMTCAAVLAVTPAISSAAPLATPGAKTSTSTTTEPTLTLDRLGGKDRYATAVAISNAVWDDGAAHGKHVYIASGENFPDALAGGPAAASQGEPLLLVPRTGTLPAGVANEIKRLAPSYITIFGGTGAVSAGMEKQLKALAGTKQIYRESGKDRYETAELLARYATDYSGSTPSYPDTVYIANGTTFADALSGGAAAALEGAPLLLTPKDRLSGSTAQILAEFNPAKVVVLGGTGAISATTVTQIKGYVKNVVRIGGVDRFDTSAKLSKTMFPVATDAAEIFLTNGLTYPDALAATPAVGVLGDVSLLLTKPKCVPSQPFAEVNRIQPDYITAIGGPAAVSDDALNGKPC